MGLFVFVLLCVASGIICIKTTAECIPETAKCSKYWEKILPHKNLIATQDDLNLWCSKQDRFYECLEDVLLEGRSGNLSHLPTNLLVSKLFAEDLCSEGSTSRNRLLNNANCINQLDTNFCILPEYLDIVTPDDSIPSTRCSQSEKTFSCIVATIVLNCGFDAGRVYRTMLKITYYGDEVCGVETSEGIPPCESSPSKSVDRDKKLSEIYYGLFHRMGNILEQDEDQKESEASVTEEEKDDHVEVVTEAIQNAIDSLEENLVSEELLPIEDANSEPDTPPTCLKEVKEYKPYMKNPRITEFMKGILFYNYSGIEYAVYWRQPEFTIIDKINCEHLQPSYMKVQIFRCKVDYRYEDPDCCSNATIPEKITPEFIRDFDPEIPCDSVIELESQPEWMKEMDRMYKKVVRDQTKSSSEVTEAPEVLTTSSSLLHLVSTASSKKLNMEKWYEEDFQEKNMNSLFPNEIHKELADILISEVENFEPPPMHRIRIGDSLFLIMYDWEFAKPTENITCSRLNECHPSGKGLWKCKVWPRKMETCDTCGKPSTESPMETGINAHPAEPNETKFTVLDTKEPKENVDETVELQDSTHSHDSITLVFSGDADSENKMAIGLSGSEAELEKLLNDMSDESADESEEADKLKYRLISDSDGDDNEIQLRILSSMLDNDSGSSDLVYAIESTEAENGESVILATEDGLLAGNIIFVKNISDLEEKVR